MPSPFPGMDPFIETQEWADFHQRMILEFSDVLNAGLPSGYGARVERRIYYENELLIEEPHLMVPDGVVLEEPEARLGGGAATAVAAVAEAVACTIPAIVEHREAWLEVVEVRTRRVITLLELLSPANKTRRHRGRRLYLRKRRKALNSRTNFIEIDLLRGGRSLLDVAPLPRCDYYALVSAAWRRPRAAIYPWSLRDPLPTIAVPLKRSEPEIPLPLGEILTSIYDRSRYRAFLDYKADLKPSLSAEDNAWAAELVARQA